MHVLPRLQRCHGRGLPELRRRAGTPAETAKPVTTMPRQRISSGSSFEDLAGYSRAVVDGDWVFVSGTTGFDYRAGTISEDIAEQTRQCFRNIGAALEQAGSGFADLVRIRIFLADAADFATVAPIVGEHCRVSRPANTTVVTPLIDPRMKIEIEVTAKKQH
jgi:enamine deaminase RidA (YjgF/YER057c/UK114 family)